MKINIHKYPIGTTPIELARYQVAVMEAAETGAVVEFTRNLEDYEWEEIKTPSWDWTDSSYRIKKSTIAIGHNPDNLTEDIVGTTDGWRLLSTDELKNIISSKIYFIDGWWNPQNKKWEYGKIDTICFSSQYRTKTNVGFYLPKKLGYIPWTLETAPKGLIFVKNHADDNITMIVSWYEEGVMANGKYVTYLELLNYIYSTDNCVNWSKCGFYDKV